MIDWEAFKKQVKTRPGKTLRFVGGLAITLTGLWIIVLIQTNSGPVDPYVTGTTYLYSSADSLNTEVKNIYVVQPDSVLLSQKSKNSVAVAVSGPVTENGRSSLPPFPFMPLLLAVIIIGGAIWLWKKINQINGVSSVKSKPGSSENMKLIDELMLGESHILRRVMVGSEVWVIGCFDGGMVLFEKLPAKNMEQLLKEDVEQSNGSPVGGFSGLLKHFSRANQEGVYGI